MGPIIGIACAVIVTAMLCGCSSTVRTDSTKLSNLKGIDPDDAPRIARADTAVAGGEQVGIDMAAEEVVAKECLEAWRKAVKGDTKAAMTQLKALEARYPRISTIKMMMGQVMEHSGNNEEAARFYKDSLEQSQFSTIRVYKLAEALRKSGKPKEAIPHYQRLVKTFPEFSDAHLGLARCLILDNRRDEAGKEFAETVKLAKDQLESKDPQANAEGKRILKELLDADPDNKEARQLLSR